MKLKSYLFFLFAYSLVLNAFSHLAHAQSIFTKNAEKHIFEGEVKSNSQGQKNASGCHHHYAFEQKKARIIESSIQNGPSGLYKAKVEVYDPETKVWVAKKSNRGYSTFFPKTWDKNKCIREITAAYQKREKVKGTQNEFRGYSPNGKFEIVMYLTEQNKIISAFPKDWSK